VKGLRQPAFLCPLLMTREPAKTENRTRSHIGGRWRLAEHRRTTNHVRRRLFYYPFARPPGRQEHPQWRSQGPGKRISQGSGLVLNFSAMEKRHPNHPGELSTDQSAASRKRTRGELEARADAIQRLTAAGVPSLVGGAYAYGSYTGIYRDTKDLDLFLRKPDALRALEVLEKDGWRTERTQEVWLYKAFKGEWFVDLIFSSGNGIASVDDEWFASARPGLVFGQKVLLTPPEEMIWSKAFVLERERFDGADVAHLFRSCARTMDWERLLRRFERYWEVLLAHLLLFQFAYPCERSAIPEYAISSLLDRAGRSIRDGDWADRICRGDLLSSINYQVDVGEWGYSSGRSWDEAERPGGRENGSRAERESPIGRVG
jgi:hypothetical protein